MSDNHTGFLLFFANLGSSSCFRALDQANSKSQHLRKKHNLTLPKFLQEAGRWLKPILKTITQF
jgi:hypothetical protein